ncbi:MAG: hypothetical protein OET44_15305 [Gammaproteobacteria bacterium]|nr:hypothetical protein [Gammaproteobacteria bacterium]
MQRRTGFRRLIGALAVCLLHGAAVADSPQEFNDRDLALLLENGARGVIYLWSPHMPYSAQGASEVQRVAAGLGVKSVLLLDPYAEPALTDLVLQSQRLPHSAARRVRAEALLSMGATQHFPTAIVFERGRLDVRMLPGYTPPQDLGVYIHQRLKNF